MTDGCYNKNCPYPGCLGLSKKNPCDAYMPKPSEVINHLRSLPLYDELKANTTNQCETCKFNGLRKCMYHGYPSEKIPSSCEYKIGNFAEEAQCNICTKLKAERERLYKILESKSVEYHGAPVIHYSEIEDIFLRSDE